jgi:hypothetical protein
MNPFYFIAVLAISLFAGCATSSGVFRVDDNRYQITTRATWELGGGRAGASRMALEEATRHCAAQRKVVRVLRSSDAYGHFEGGTVDMTFSCEQEKP